MEAKKEVNIKLLNELVKYRRYCKCGHSVIITPTSKRNRVMCTWRGNYIYKNDLEEFKENIKRVLK